MPKRNRCNCPASAPAWPECCNLNASADSSGLTAATAVDTEQEPSARVFSVVDSRIVPSTPLPTSGGMTPSGSKSSGHGASYIGQNLAHVRQPTTVKSVRQQTKADAAQHIPEAVRTLVALMRGAKTEKIRRDCANDLIQMVIGKPGTDQTREDKTQDKDADQLEEAVLESILDS